MHGSGPRGPGARRSGPLRSLALLVAVGAAAAACTEPPADVRGRPAPGPTLTTPATLRIGVGPIASLDPARIQSADEVLAAAQVFDGLVAVDPATGGALPAVARRWEVLAGGRRFVFRLGEASFHDGSQVRAQDFVAAWERLVDPLATHPFAFLLEEVEGFGRHRLTFGAEPFSGVVARDDRTLEIRLRRPNHGFPTLLAHPALSPVPQGAGDEQLAVRPVGNGPYAVAEDVGLGTPILLEAAEGARVGVPRVELHRMSEPEEGWPDFLAGELDVAEIPAPLIDDLAGTLGKGGVRPVGRLLHCGFNVATGRFPRALRTAVSVGVDRAALVQLVHGNLARPAEGLVPPRFPGYRRDACEGDCDYRPQRARRLVRRVPERVRTFRLDFPRSSVGREVVVTVRDQLAEVGLTVRLRRHEEAAYAELLRSGEHGAFCLVAVADAPTAQAVLDPMLSAGSPDNHTGIEDEELQRLLDEARETAGPRARMELYASAERRALDLLPVVPIAWFRSRVAAQPHVAGLEVDPLGRFDVAALRIEA